MRAAWHAPASRSELRQWKRRRPRPLVFIPVGRNRRFELTPASRRGGFDAEDMRRARQALAYRGNGPSRDIHPRLIELVYRAVRHFEAPYVHVVSGYRPARPTSRHFQGRAVDFVLPGVSDDQLASFLRQQGFVGVGIYPTSGFVHLDVRNRSYFWVDRSGPEQPNEERPVRTSLVRRVDHAAGARREERVEDANVEGANDTDRAEPASIESTAQAAAEEEEATAGTAPDAGTPAMSDSPDASR